MRFRLTDFIKICAEYVANAPTFDSALEFVQSGVSNEDITALKMWLRRYKNYEISFYLADSSTDAKGCKKIVIKTGKAGRPKTQVKGKKVGRHIHGLIISTSKNTDIKAVKNDLNTYCNKRRKKNQKLKQQKISIINDMFLAKYFNRQSDHEYRGGVTFDFDYFKDERYFIPYKENEQNANNLNNILDF
jgi:hypothetical protein